MVIDVTPVFAAYLARNRTPVPGDPEARQPADYGVSATLNGGVINLELTFRAGSVYCCYEWGCHLALHSGVRWEKLRRALASHGVAVPARLKLRLSCVIEEGAVFFNLLRPDPTRRNWYAFEPVAAYHYEISAVEAVGAPDAEPDAAADRRGM